MGTGACDNRRAAAIGWATATGTSGRATDTSEVKAMNEGFQLEGTGPEAYERYLVPAFFAECAARLLEVAPAEPGERVLDVACGTGIVVRRAAARVGPGGTLLGVDLNDGMIDVARAVSAEVSTIDWRQADAAALPLPDAAFDVAYCQQGLQFVTDQAGALGEMHRVVAPGGRVAVAIWRAIEHNPAFAAFAQVLEQHAGAEAAALMGAPFAGPDRHRLRRLMRDAGFEDPVVRIGVTCAHFPSAAELLRRQALSSPLAGPVGALDRERREALQEALAAALEPYADDDGVALPMQTWLATARR
jgi:ubiquinone/menaquinone biosynthesis C-methylase UbiE